MTGAGPGPVDLVRLEDADGSFCVVRVTGPSQPVGETLRADVLLSTSFLDARLDVHLFPQDLDDWQGGLIELAPGRDLSIGNERGLTLMLHMFEDRSLAVTVHDPDRLTAMFGIDPEENWIDDHHERVNQVRRSWWEGSPSGR